jgi:hypothetical protein
MHVPARSRGLATLIGLCACGRAHAARQPVPLPLTERPLVHPPPATTMAVPQVTDRSRPWDLATVDGAPALEAGGAPRNRGVLKLTNVAPALRPSGLAAEWTANEASDASSPLAAAGAAAAGAAAAAAAAGGEAPSFSPRPALRSPSLPPSPPRSSGSPPPSSRFGHRHRRQARPPPPPPRPRELPLWANITTLGDRSSAFVRSHVGLEAAAALLAAALLSLWGLCHVCSRACGYSLCCFGRGKVSKPQLMGDTSHSAGSPSLVRR